jgi:hypothetical protein
MLTLDSKREASITCLARTYVAQPSLGALQLSFELTQARARSQAPPVQPRAQKRHLVAAIAQVRPC